MPSKIILSAFYQELNTINIMEDDRIGQANLGVILCKKTLGQLKEVLLKNGLANQQEEIHFFKNVKAAPMGYLIYFKKVMAFEMGMPKLDIKCQLNFLAKHILKTNKHLRRYEGLSFYKEQKHSHLDELYFTRKYQDNIPPIELYYRSCYRDPIFHTSHDLLWAEMKAYDLFLRFLCKRQSLLNSETGDFVKEESDQNTLKWTLSKASAVEMIYGIHCIGALNHGQAEIKKIAVFFEQFFKIDLGDYYGTFIQIRSRKINRTKFLDELKLALLKKMDEGDQ